MSNPDRRPPIGFIPLGALAGPPFDPDNIEVHLAAWKIRRAI
jgi:hypothetical protein